MTRYLLYFLAASLAIGVLRPSVLRCGTIAITVGGPMVALALVAVTDPTLAPHFVRRSAGVYGRR